MSNNRLSALNNTEPAFKLFKDRFELKGQLSKGSFGQVYQVVDRLNIDDKLVAKIQED